MSEKQLEMPRFDFGGVASLSDEAVEAEAAEGKATDRKYFDPGKYDVEIDEVEFLGMEKNDPDWGKMKITLKQDTKTALVFLQVPFKTPEGKGVKYGPKETYYPWNILKEFCGALGTELKPSTLGDTMKSLFGRPEKLKGRVLSVTVGYQKGYVKYVGKNADGTKNFHLCTRDGNAVCGDDGQVLVFPDAKAAQEVAKARNIEIDFARVTSFAPSANAKKAASSNW